MRQKLPVQRLEEGIVAIHSVTLIGELLGLPATVWRGGFAYAGCFLSLCHGPQDPKGRYEDVNRCSGPGRRSYGSIVPSTRCTGLDRPAARFVQRRYRRMNARVFGTQSPGDRGKGPVSLNDEPVHV